LQPLGFRPNDSIAVCPPKKELRALSYNRKALSMNKRRLEQLEQTLERILRALEEHYQPEQVIVFGSLASLPRRAIWIY